jgi:adenylate cyclase
VFDELGALSLKNIARPVEAFLVRLEPEATEPRLLSSARLPRSNVIKSKPPRLSVLVAPLRNLGVPKEHEYLVEGIPEDISADLSQCPGTFVVGSPEALRRDGDPASPRDIGRELGLGYVIQGSIRGIADRLAVNLQLIDVETGAYLQSERFDIDLGGTTDTRNEITNRLAWSLFLKLAEDVNRRIAALSPEDWTADDLVMRGVALFHRPVAVQNNTDPNRQEALQCFERALAKVPQSIPAKIGVASILVATFASGGSLPGGQHEVRAEQLLGEVLRVKRGKCVGSPTDGDTSSTTVSFK